MSGIRLISIGLLACVVVMICDDVQAQGRPFMPDLSPIEQEAGKLTANLDDATRARRMTELDAWLRRLVGRFHIDGTVLQGRNNAYLQSAKVQGVADCVLIGSGPGVQCMLNASWAQLVQETGSRSGTQTRPTYSQAFNTSRPMMMLFGLDPDAVGIQLFTTDETGQDWLGKLIYNKDDLLRGSGCDPDAEHCIEFVHESDCDPDVTHCFARIVFVAKPDRDLIRLDLRFPAQLGISLRLHRELEAQAGEGSSKAK